MDKLKIAASREYIKRKLDSLDCLNDEHLNQVVDFIASFKQQCS